MKKLSAQEKEDREFLKKHKAWQASLDKQWAKQKALMEKCIDLAKKGLLTPAKFKKNDDRFRWRIARELSKKKNIIWLCEDCKSFQGTDMPSSMFFDGDSRECTECGNELTRRTEGGCTDEAVEREYAEIASYRKEFEEMEKKYRFELKTREHLGPQRFNNKTKDKKLNPSTYFFRK